MEGTIQMSEEMECAICQAPLEKEGSEEKHALACGHMFHGYCVAAYMEAKGACLNELPCPTCKITGDQAMEMSRGLLGELSTWPAASGDEEAATMLAGDEGEVRTPPAEPTVATKGGGGKAKGKGKGAKGKKGGKGKGKNAKGAPPPEAIEPIDRFTDDDGAQTADAAADAAAASADAAPASAPAAADAAPSGPTSGADGAALSAEAGAGGPASAETASAAAAAGAATPGADGAGPEGEAEGGMEGSLFSGEVMCSSCGTFTHYVKCRVLSKSQNTWRCSKCACKMTQLYRAFGRWPVPSFAGMTELAKQDFVWGVSATFTECYFLMIVLIFCLDSSSGLFFVPLRGRTVLLCE